MPKRAGETSYKQTAFGIIPRSKLIPLEIEGIKKAWDFVLQESEKSKIPFTSAFIKKVHNIGFGWIFPEMGGKFRTISVQVSQHIAPRHYLIPQLMEDMLKDLTERLKHIPNIDNPVFLDQLTSLLAWAHHRFLWIHPFVDYNGRIGRLLINIILLNLQLPVINLKVETKAKRKEYIRALSKADSGDYADLEKIIQEALKEAAQYFSQ